MDISTIEVKADSRPEWCRMDKLNRQLSEIDENQEIAIKGMAALFGAKDVFEEDDEREAVKIVRCKDCQYRFDAIRCQIYSEGMKTNDDWFCADGERR